MATVYWNSMTFVCAIVFFVFLARKSQGLVHELNKKNIAKFLQGKLLTLTFVDAPDCDRCRILFPFFVAASQMFPHDPEVFFTRTKDTNLTQEWALTELPAIVFHRDGTNSYEIQKIDITVDDIINAVARTLRSNFAGLTRTYSVYVDEKNYQELIIQPKQYVLLLIHDKHDTKEKAVLEKIAYAFRKDDAILFASLDVAKYRKLRDDMFITKDTPVMMWYSLHDKSTIMQFGGVLSDELLTLFVNERTGLNRNKDGSLQPESGHIPEADEIINDNIVRIMEGTPEDVESVISQLGVLETVIDSHHLKMLEYYIYILKNMADAGSPHVLKDLLHEAKNKLIENNELSTKEQETMKRQRNIASYFHKLAETYDLERKTKTKKQLQRAVRAGEREQKKKTFERSHEHFEL